MNYKTIWRAASALTAAFTFSSLAACSLMKTPRAQTTTFVCLQETTGQWVTVAQRGDVRSSGPILTWNTSEFGSNWPPEKRCKHVSEKFTRAVQNNGGLLADLVLTYGPVNNYMTICLARMPATCDANNMLFTLSDKNKDNPGEVLLKIANFADNKAANSTIDESAGLRYLLVEDVVKFERFRF